jgi:hypothetical protein
MRLFGGERLCTDKAMLFLLFRRRPLLLVRPKTAKESGNDIVVFGVRDVQENTDVLWRGPSCMDPRTPDPARCAI